jgi:hypothetical protein
MSLINRHATKVIDAANLDTIGDLDEHGAELVVRGVAERRIDPYRPTSSNAITPRQGYAPNPAYRPHAYSPFSGELPAHVADQMTPGLADRTGWSFFQWLQDKHLLPSAAVIAGLVCGWGTALTEPRHAILGAFTAAAGLIFSFGYGGIHVIRSINSDTEPLDTAVHVLGLGGIAVTAFGVVCITGPSFYGAGVTLLELAGAYYAWFQHRHTRLSDQRGFTVAYHAAVTPQLVPMPGQSVAQAEVIEGRALSHEEALIHNAFEGIGVAITQVHNFQRINESSFRATVVLAAQKGVSPDSIIGRKDVVRSALHANQVVIEKTRRGDEVRLTVRYGEIDELAETIPFPGITVRSIKNPIPLGPSATGEMTMLPLWRNHTVIGGTTNNGKSGLVNVIAVQIAAMEDALLVLLDNKPGQLELGIYEDVAYAYSDSFERAALILEAMVAVINVRGAILKRRRIESGQPERGWSVEDGPALVGLIDELAELFRNQKQSELKKIKNPVLRRAIEHMSDNYVRICQVGRAYDVELVIATQKPDALASGGVKSGTDQAQNRICVPTAGPRLTNIVLHDGAHGEGFRASELDTAGKFLMTTLKERIAVERKAFWITDEEIAAFVEQYKDSRPELDEESHAAFQAIMNGVEPDFTAPTPFDDPDGDDEEDYEDERFEPQPGRAPLRLVPRYPDGTEIETKHLAAWEMLATFGDRGATVAELSVAAKRAGHEHCSLAWVRNLAAEWRAAGYVVVEQQGRDYRYWRNDEALRREFQQAREDAS